MLLVAPSESASRARIVVVGGGNAGLSVAARLARMGCTDITIIEPKQTHTYRPLLSYIGSGNADLSISQRPQGSVIPDGCCWIRATVTEVDASRNLVHVSDGPPIAFDALVLCPGLIPDWDRCPGLDRALHSETFTTNYLPDLAAKTWRLVREMRSGAAVFSLPAGPVPNAGSALKALFMSCAYWKKTGILRSLEVRYVTPTTSIFDVPQVDALLKRRAEDYGVQLLTTSTLDEVGTDPPSVTVTHDGDQHVLPVDLAHIVPPYRGPEWITASGLATSPLFGLVEVDERTLQHTRFPAIWSLGDAADTGNSKAGAAIRKQSTVLARNLNSWLREAPLTETYDGYSAAPIATDTRQMVFAEFGENYERMPTTKLVDLARERRSTWLFDRYALPQMYWRLILKGRL